MGNVQLNLSFVLVIATSYYLLFINFRLPLAVPLRGRSGDLYNSRRGLHVRSCRFKPLLFTFVAEI